MKLDGSTLAAILATVGAVAGWLEAREQRLAGQAEKRSADTLYADRETAWAELVELRELCRVRSVKE